MSLSHRRNRSLIRCNWSKKRKQKIGLIVRGTMEIDANYFSRVNRKLDRQREILENNCTVLFIQKRSERELKVTENLSLIYFESAKKNHARIWNIFSPFSISHRFQFITGTLR